MDIKYTVVSSTPENNNFRVEAEDENGRPLTVVLPFSVAADRTIVLDAEESSSEGESVPV